MQLKKGRIKNYSCLIRKPLLRFLEKNSNPSPHQAIPDQSEFGGIGNISQYGYILKTKIHVNVDFIPVQIFFVFSNAII
jgi:hypothetical protein